ncbi:MAG TPA: carotenoid oxygenase family protein [Acidimicrobiales bacterium]|nr:carotenoid oxygenase family protein [Acidimicrobiales bacterium]
MPIPRTLFSMDPPADHDLSVTQGVWPADLDGELLLSAPHPTTLDGPHPFFGDGTTYRLSLHPGRHGAPSDGFAWRQRRIDSPSSRLRVKRPDVFTPTVVGVQSPFGHTNAANTAPLPWKGRLFATWDAGRPVELDPVTLGYLGDVGRRDEWIDFEVSPQPLLPMVMTTAHPVIDTERDLFWTVNTHWGSLHVVCWDGEGPLRSWPITSALIPQSVHTIAHTRDWIIVGDCAFKVEPQVLAGGDRTEGNNRVSPLYLIRKETLLATPPGDEVACTTVQIEPEINHYYATWDDSGGVQVLFEHVENTDIAMTQQPGDLDALGRPCDPALRGLYGLPMSPDRTSVVTFDPESGAVLHRAEQREPELLWTRQLNAMDWSDEGRTHPTVHHTVHQGWRPEGITQKMLALYRDRVDESLFPGEETAPLVVTSAMPDLEITHVHELGLDDFPSSPIYAPRTGESDPGGHDGYVVVPIMNDAGFRVEVFDAADVSTGPLATLSKPGFTVPFLLHSAFTSSAKPAPDVERVRFADELDRIGELDDELAKVALEVAHELDEGISMDA